MATPLDRRGLHLAACVDAGYVPSDPRAPGATPRVPGARADQPGLSVDEPRASIEVPPTAVGTATGVDIWRADLNAVDEELVELLSPEERARAARLARSENRVRWMRARGALRALLGDYLECDPTALRFITGPHGKPALDRERGLSFNLSHSGALAVYAFARGPVVGIDVEVLDRNTHRDHLALAERVFAPEVARRMRTLAPTARRREFLREWVRHEARLKCLGVGLAGSDKLAEADSSELWVSELEIGPDAVAAVAVQVEPGQPA
jgi:4'-phosphopantetheinyl transferase